MHNSRVALRKESVDRNQLVIVNTSFYYSVALRKESVDRNRACIMTITTCIVVALRKESVDRNLLGRFLVFVWFVSLSARRAWIEILTRNTFA